MSDKEASVFVIDLGQSMGCKMHGRQQSDLDYSLQYVYDKIMNIVATGRKTLLVGLIGFRTDGTKNHMQNEDGYENITVMQPIQQMLIPEIQRLPAQLVPSHTDSGDALSAVILAVDMLHKHCRQLKYIKHLYLITNGTGPLDADDLEATAAQIKQNDIRLTVLGVDFDDAEYGFKEENKPFEKAQNERALKRLVDLTDGVYGTMDEAIEGLARPHLKPVRPMPSYKGQLRLGGPDYDTAITIDVERYPKVMVRRPPPASSFVVKDGAPSRAEDAGASDGLANVRVAYSYQIKDEDSATGYRDIPREDLAKGYEYGRTAVHISESDENVTKLETEQTYEILGFIPQENVERYMMMGPTNMIVAQKLNDKAAIALSSLTHALFEIGSVAVARFVQKDMKEPMLVLLSAHITEDVECLIENDLPFAEDLRVYRFPPIDKVVTVSGKTLTSHRHLPSDELLSAMSDYVDKLSLVGESTEEKRFAIDDVFSPIFHTLDSAIKFRALHPGDELPPKPEIVLEPSQIPEDIQVQSKPALDKLVKLADVKKVPPKVKGRSRYRDRENEKPISGLDIDALLKKTSATDGPGNGPRKTIKIDRLNAIPEFKRLMHRVDDEELIKSGVKQMGSIVEELVRTSFGDSNYSRAVETLGVVRGEMIDYEMSDLYNDLIKELKRKVIKDELGGDRKEFWWRTRISRLGLIDNEESESSEVGKEEAQKFMSLKE